MKWTPSNIPFQRDTLFVITGANAGLGLATARALSAKGGEIVMAVRNLDKGEKAADAIRAEQPNAKLHVMALDLSRLESIRAFANAFLASFDKLNVLINNAGIYESGIKRTAEGFALMMGVNHLGHFALTGLLLDRLLTTPHSRVVTLSSGAYRSGKLDLDNFHTIEAAASGAYGKSKLANMLFMRELQRRLDRINS
ncbi:MAG: SDR family NAD(P)-dependent oxidoreductase, partial [Chloroflexota bacterium]